MKESSENFKCLHEDLELLEAVNLAHWEDSKAGDVILTDNWTPNIDGKGYYVYVGYQHGRGCRNMEPKVRAKAYEVASYFRKKFNVEPVVKNVWNAYDMYLVIVVINNLNESKFRESGMKSFMKHMCEKVKRAPRLKESLKNSLDFQDIRDAMENDKELAKFMNTPLKELPENYKYIIGRDSWEAMKDVTPAEYSEFFYKMYSYFDRLLSEKDDELLGWISYNAYGPTIFDIKMFSFKPKYQNITFMRGLKEFFETIVNKYQIINWTADKENPFIKHYYKAIEEYNGEAIESEDGFTVSFIINKFKNRKDESKLKEKESEKAEEAATTTLSPSHYAAVRVVGLGSALGEQVANLEDQVVAEFDTREEAEERVNKLNAGILPEEKELLGTEYKVKEIKQTEEN